MPSGNCEDCGRKLRYPIHIMNVVCCEQCFPMRALGAQLTIDVGRAIREYILAERNLEAAKDANPFDLEVIQDLETIRNKAKNSWENADLKLTNWKDVLTLEKAKKDTGDLAKEYQRAFPSPEEPPEGGSSDPEEDDELPF